ncbi:MAG: archaetidylserine decarboxylase, partial [bacterium]|nr:archaetidylserine decarboxylase [bacterium]
LLQAKGWHYGLADLLGDRRQAARFLGGSFTTLYLSPADYHRIHMPLDGRVESLRSIPGHLFPVNRFSLHAVENLFVLNERIVLHFTTDAGDLAMVLVGATNVGKIRIAFDDGKRRLSRSRPFERQYGGEVVLRRGEELGRFELGSTVILIFEKGGAVLEVDAGDRVEVGRSIGFIP